MDNQLKNSSCPCKREQCIRHGDCKACQAHHRQKDALTACERLKQREERAARRKPKNQ